MKPPRTPAQMHPIIMKTTLTARFTVAFLALATAISSAQNAPALSSSAPAKEEAVLLSPFTVTTDRDVGFVAASSLAGGRLATDLADTPVA